MDAMCEMDPRKYVSPSFQIVTEYDKHDKPHHRFDKTKPAKLLHYVALVGVLGFGIYLLTKKSEEFVRVIDAEKEVFK
jgi:hypothetical protein